MHRSTVQHLLDSARRRAVAQSVLIRAGWGAAAGAGAAVVLLLGSRAMPFELPTLVIAAPALAGLLVGAILGAILAPSADAVAALVDKRLELADRVSTVVAIERASIRADPGFAALVRQESEARTAGLRAADAISVRLGAGWLWTAIALVMVAIGAALIPIRVPTIEPPEAPDVAAARQAILDELAQATSSLAAARQDPTTRSSAAGATPSMASELADERLRELDRLAERLAQPLPASSDLAALREEAAAALDRAADEAEREALASEMAADQAAGEFAALTQREAPPRVASLAEALRDGRFGDAVDALRDLEANASQLNDAERAALAEYFRDLADRSERASRAESISEAPAATDAQADGRAGDPVPPAPRPSGAAPPADIDRTQAEFGAPAAREAADAPPPADESKASESEAADPSPTQDPSAASSPSEPASASPPRTAHALRELADRLEREDDVPPRNPRVGTPPSESSNAANDTAPAEPPADRPASTPQDPEAQSRRESPPPAQPGQPEEPPREAGAEQDQSQQSQPQQDQSQQGPPQQGQPQQGQPQQDQSQQGQPQQGQSQQGQSQQGQSQQGQSQQGQSQQGQSQQGQPQQGQSQQGQSQQGQPQQGQSQQGQSQQGQSQQGQSQQGQSQQGQSQQGQPQQGQSQSDGSQAGGAASARSQGRSTSPAQEVSQQPSGDGESTERASDRGADRSAGGGTGGQGSQSLEQLLEDAQQARDSAASQRRMARELRDRAEEVGGRVTASEREQRQRWSAAEAKEEGIDDAPARATGSVGEGSIGEDGTGADRERSAAPPRRASFDGTEDIDLREGEGRGETIAEWFDDGPTAEGSPQGVAPRVARRVIEAQRTAERAIEHSSLPSRYHPLLRRYFGRFDRAVDDVPRPAGDRAPRPSGTAGPSGPSGAARPAAPEPSPP